MHAQALSRAFRSRFLELHVGDIPDAELATILQQRCALAPSYSTKLVAVMRELQRRRQVCCPDRLCLQSHVTISRGWWAGTLQHHRLLACFLSDLICCCCKHVRRALTSLCCSVCKRPDSHLSIKTGMFGLMQCDD